MVELDRSPLAPLELTCPSCGTPLSTPLLCERCGALLAPPATATPFQLLGLTPAYDVDMAATKKRVLVLTRALHPDFHANGDDVTRQRAQDGTAALNAAFHVLVDDARRAEWLVSALGGPREDEERAMPPAFLQEVLEWNEAIEEARSASSSHTVEARNAASGQAVAALDPLADQLGLERSRLIGRIAALLTPLPPPGAPALREVRHQLNAVRYLDRALRELAELRLATNV